MRIHIDDSELKRLEVDISAAPGRMQRNASEATVKGARVVNREMKIDATGHQGNVFGRPGTGFDTPLQKHVSYELLTPLEAEIGIEYQGAGKLGHIIAKGSVNNAPAYDYMAGPRRSLQQVERVYAEAAEESVLGGGS